MTAVEAHDLVKNYPGGVRALDCLSITVRPGEVFGLLGPNGAGKTTTVKILTTLTRPDGGTATVAGHDVLRQPDRVRRRIGVVAQKSGADPMATGRDNLMLQGHLYGMRGATLNRRVAELVDRLDLGAVATTPGRRAASDAAEPEWSKRRPVRTYSGGMQRRLDVALGLVHRPAVLFLDEPTTGLDPEARAAMWEEVGRLAADESMAILLTTHYLEEADRLCDRLAIVDSGRVVATGTPGELKAQLRGDAVHIELRAAPDEAVVRQVVGTVPGVREISLDGLRLSARADDAAAAAPGALAALDQAGVPVAAVTIARPSLDDVYLRHAGRRFAEADGAR
jgi:ABC-2 type transport system ATP-binding protein